MNVPLDQIAELQLLAARAEASVDASFGSARYCGMRDVALQESVGFSAPFHMFAISVELDGPVGTKGAVHDVMFCRTPEIAKFIVALLNFGGAIVAEYSEPKGEHDPGWPRCPRCQERHATESFQLGGFPANTCPNVSPGMLVMSGADGSSVQLVEKPESARFIEPQVSKS